MKHKFSFIVTLWWVILCAVAGLFLLILSNKQDRMSETENRMLAGFPRLSAQSAASGDFMEDFEDFLTDGFIGRDGAIAATERLMGNFSLLTGDDRMAAEAADMESRLDLEGGFEQADAPEPAGPAIDIHESAVAAPDRPAGMDEADDEAEDAPITLPPGGIPIDAAHSYLWLEKADGGKNVIYTYDNDKIAIYADTLKLMQTFLPEDGVICFTQVPLSQIGNRWTDQPHTYTGWGSSVEIVLEKYLEDTERIYVFSTFDILAPYMTGGVPMFYHTDHHWSAEGAYLVLSEMLRRQNLPVIPYDEYSYKAIRGHVNDKGQVDTFNALYPLLPGHSYIVTGRTNAREIDLMNYGVRGYLTFMNGTQLPWRRIVTGADTGRKALVICDSFGNALTPYLLAYYDEVHMCDFRYDSYDVQAVGGTIGEQLRYYGIDDVYIITSTANGLRKDNSIVYLRRFLAG